MDKTVTRQFLRRARSYATRHKLSGRTLSKRLFNKNPYGLERLEEAMKTETGGPPHVNVLQAMKRLDDLEEEDKERVAALTI